jgi:hypothetical protein
MQQGETIRLPKKLVWILGALLLLAIVLSLTKPSRAEHEAWLKEHYVRPLDLRPARLGAPPETPDEILRKRFDYHDYGFYSTMTTTPVQGGRVVSYGYLGAVYEASW